MERDTAVGLGSGVLTAWVYDTFIAPAAGLEPMAATVSPIIGGALYVAWRYIVAFLPQAPSRTTS